MHFDGLFTTEILGFSSVPVQINCSLHALVVIIQLPNQVKFKDSSQLINGIFNVLQKLLKSFNGTAISIPFFLFSSPFNSPTVFVL